MDWKNTIILVLLILIIFKMTMLYLGVGNDLYVLKQCKYITSSIDGQKYCVQNKDQSSADLLAILNSRLLVLIRKLKIKYGEHSKQLLIDDIIVNPHNVTVNILNNYNQDNLVENIQRHDSTSFTINKGSILGMCLKTDGEYVDINTLTYVGIHELAHLGIDTVSHNKEFWATFKFLLSESDDIYTHVDYIKSPVNYCGLTINTGPL